MSLPRFTLLVVASEDGFMADRPGRHPVEWASAEEQALFLAAVDLADWSVMGRGTHEATPKPWRRRIVFSSSAPEPQWRNDRQLWINPRGREIGEIVALVAPVHPLLDGLILGAAAVHAWFHEQRRIDAVELTVEPLSFGAGLPIFPDQTAGDPVGAFTEKGYRVRGERRVNAQGTRLVSLAPG